MLLFPIGHSETTIGRHPWVSWSLIAASVLIHGSMAVTGAQDPILGPSLPGSAR